MPDYPNPYEFVPLENTQSSRRAWSPENDGIGRWRPDRYTGRLHGIVHPETPLFIHGEGQQTADVRHFRRLGNRPGIPASSLKGAIRSIYEIVSDSCISTLSESYKITKQQSWALPSGAIPDAYQPCTRLDHACPACLVFGMVERRKDDAGKEGTPLAGRVRFSPATPVRPQYQMLSIPKTGGGPHPWHKAFYFDNAGNGAVLGRKLYYHHRDYRQTIALYGTGGRPGLASIEVHSGDFAFQVDFTNLTEIELASLIYALVLEDRMRHKLGYGKPYGLGSILISIPQIELWQQPGVAGTERFLHWDATAGQAVEQAAGATIWRDKGLGFWLARPNARPSYDAFTRILAWPGAGLYKYPSYQWFHDPAHNNRAIALAQWQKNPGRQGSAVTAPTPSSPQPTSPSGRQRGRVQRFDPDLGYGFIEIPGQSRGLFVHKNNIQGRVALRPGQEVEYSIGPGQRGDEAKDVVILPPGGRR